MKPSGIHHVSLCVKNVDEAVAFYTDVLGLTVRSDRPDFGFPGAWLDAAGEQVHLIEAADPQVGGGHFAIRVDDLDTAVDDVRSAGWTVHTTPYFTGAGRQAFLNDPSGNQIELNQPDR